MKRTGVMSVYQNKMRSLPPYIVRIEEDEDQQFSHNDFIRICMWRDKRKRSLTDCW